MPAGTRARRWVDGLLLLTERLSPRFPHVHPHQTQSVLPNPGRWIVGRRARAPMHHRGAATGTTRLSSSVASRTSAHEGEAWHPWSKPQRRASSSSHPSTDSRAPLWRAAPESAASRLEARAAGVPRYPRPVRLHPALNAAVRDVVHRVRTRRRDVGPPFAARSHSPQSAVARVGTQADGVLRPHRVNRSPCTMVSCRPGPTLTRSTGTPTSSSTRLT